MTASQRAPLIPEVELLERLIHSLAYQELLQHETAFDLFVILGKLRLSENASSRVLAYLLDSTQDHGLGTRFFETLLRLLASTREDDYAAPVIRRLLAAAPVDINCTTEWSTRGRRRLDILAHLVESQHMTAGLIGIENKHLAEEQEMQVSDYQRELVERFPGDVPRLLLFLAPGARRCRTAIYCPECPHVEVSYRETAAAIRSCCSDVSGPLAVFVASLANHFEHTLERGGEMNREVIALVHSLYKDPDHRRAIRLIKKHLPNFGNLLPRIQQQVFKERFPSLSFACYTYPTRIRAKLQQAWFEPTELRPLTKPHGFVLYYVLHADHKAIDWGVPDADDEVYVQLLASCKKAVGRDAVKSLGLSSMLPPSRVGLQRFEQKWFPIWSAGKYRLSDLDTLDVDGCSRLLIDAIDATYSGVKAAVEREYGAGRTDG